jgi:hypothetical protein
MDLSFKAFALKEGFSLPVSAAAVASSLHVVRPVSLRALIATAAPYQPILISWAVAASGTSFEWYDEANLPPWIWAADGSSYGPPNPLRAATSFEFKLWQNPGGNLVTDTTIPVTNAVGGGLPIVFSPGVLDGSFKYQIVALNSSGSASAGPQGPITITPPAPGPTITAQSIGTNMFQVQGSGFGNWANTTVNINVEIGIGASPLVGQSPVPTVQVDGQGAFSVPVTATICSGHAGAQLTLSVSQPNSFGAISNLLFKTCM